MGAVYGAVESPPVPLLAADAPHGVTGFLLDICIATAAAALGGIAARLLRQPLMVGFLGGGIAVGAIPGLVQDPHSVEHISEVGLLFLLFLIGLEIEPHRILGKGVRPALVAVCQVPACALVAWVVLALLGPLVPGPLGDLASDPRACLVVAVALAIPSAEVITKVLADRHELSTDAGRVTRAALGAKALWVLLAFAMLPALKRTLDPGELWRSGLLALSELGIAAVVGRFALPWVFRVLWRSPELVLLTAIGWGFGLAATAHYFHLPLEMGALLAGMALSTHPVGESIAVRLRSLRDFFHTLFFVAVGMKLKWPDPAGLLSASVALGLVVGTRVATVAPMVLATGGGRRAAATATLHLSQMSIFAVVMVSAAATLGVGALPGVVAEFREFVLMPVYAVAALLTTYAVGFTPQVARAVERSMSSSSIAPPRAVLILGFHRTGSTLLAELLAVRSQGDHQVHVVDWNLEAFRALTAQGIAATYGDLSDPETLERAGAKHARVIVCTLEDHELQGTDTRHLVRLARRINPHARIVAVASTRAEVKALRQAGADDVLTPRHAVAHGLVPRVLGALQSQPAHPDPRWRDEIVP